MSEHVFKRLMRRALFLIGAVTVIAMAFVSSANADTLDATSGDTTWTIESGGDVDVTVRSNGESDYHLMISCDNGGTFEDTVYDSASSYSHEVRLGDCDYLDVFIEAVAEVTSIDIEPVAKAAEPEPSVSVSGGQTGLAITGYDDIRRAIGYSCDAAAYWTNEVIELNNLSKLFGFPIDTSYALALAEVNRAWARAAATSIGDPKPC